eukprot:1670442-Alexandrium_andersonii.AAC.1
MQAQRGLGRTPERHFQREQRRLVEACAYVRDGVRRLNPVVLAQPQCCEVPLQDAATTPTR